MTTMTPLLGCRAIGRPLDATKRLIVLQGHAGVCTREVYPGVLDACQQQVTGANSIQPNEQPTRF
jgi:hypothetical protein